MLDSVISLSEEENRNNNASHWQQNMTREAEDDKQEEETKTSNTQHFTKNPNLAPNYSHHIKEKNTKLTEDKNDNEIKEGNEKGHQRKILSQQNSDRTYEEDFTLARKKGRPIYAVRANYRFVLHKIPFCYKSITQPRSYKTTFTCSTWVNSNLHVVKL